MPVEVDDELEKYAAKPEDDELAKYASASHPSEAQQVSAGLPKVSTPTPAGLQPSPTFSGPMHATRWGMVRGEPTDFQPAEDAKRQAAEENEQNLRTIAATGKEIPGSRTAQTALRTVGDISGVGEGLFSPQSAAIGAAMTNPVTGIPTSIGLVGHGLYNAISNTPAALKGDPEAIQRSLFGGSEAAMGGAGLKSYSPVEALRNVARKALLDPVTGEPTITPTTVAKRVLRTPEEIGEAKAAKTEAQMKEIEKTRQKELAANERLKELDARSRMARKEEPVGNIISTPGVGEPRMTGSEGRAATWTNETVQKLASQGNREAIQQSIRRGIELPPNARYVMGSPDFERTIYNPRESTRFDPEGRPIRNVENPTERAPRSRIVMGGESVGKPIEPAYAYRAHTTGQPEIDLGAHAHATASPEEAASYAEHREGGEGQQVSKINLNRFKPEEYEATKGPNGNTWYKFKRPLSEDDYE